MSIEEVFKRVHELTGKYPHLSVNELKDLRDLTKGLAIECSELIHEKNTNYLRLNFADDTLIEDAVKVLLGYKAKGIKACGEFNKVMLYSDKVTLDSAYLELTGFTYTEYHARV